MCNKNGIFLILRHFYKGIVFSLMILFQSVGLFAQDNFPPPGELVDLGGYKMHLIVEGEKHGGPTVIFFHGAGDIALHWNLILPKVGEFATAVAFDQNGEGWSEHGHGAALNQQVYDSYQALQKGGFEGPYIVVGHSLGGILANLFAENYSEEIAGIVLVDATHPDVVLKVYDKDLGKMKWTRMRLLADQPIPTINKSPLKEKKSIQYFQVKRNFGNKLSGFSKTDQDRFNWIYNIRSWSYVPGQSDTYEAEIFQEMYNNREQYHLGDTPIIVMSGGNKTLKEGDENWSSEELKEHSESLQKDLLNLSSVSEHIIVENAGHQIHLEQPDKVVLAIKKFFK